MQLGYLADDTEAKSCSRGSGVHPIEWFKHPLSLPKWDTRTFVRYFDRPVMVNFNANPTRTAAVFNGVTDKIGDRSLY